jgi:outer membrane protein TolC
MLRITVHENGSSWRLQLEGKLTGDGVSEAEKAWRAAPETGKPIEVDLTGLTAVDDAGEVLLRALNQAGAHFLTEGVAMKALIAEITSGATGKGRAWRRLGHYLMFFAFSASFVLHAQQPSGGTMRLTLKDAVAVALRQNPQVAIANLNLAQSQENGNVARAGLLPQVAFGASDTVTRGNIEALLGTRIPGFPQHNGPFRAIQAGPEFSAPLFDLTLWHRWRAAREQVRTSEAQRTTARELNAQLVVSQYLGGLKAAADVKAAQSRLDLAKALFDLATDLQKRGVGTGIDTLRANVQYQNERQKYSEAQTELSVSLYGLSRLLNLDPQVRIELADEPSFFQTPEFSSEEGLAQAYEARPEMKAVLSQIRSTESLKRAARDQALPRLSLDGGWSLEGLTPTTMIPTYQYRASVQVPLFTGGRIQAETASADLELKKLRQQADDIRNQIALEVKTAIARLASARTEVEAANLGVDLAREGVTEAQDRFRAGVANNIEVVTAKDELSRANDNQITAFYRYNQSRADLARATGQMETLYAK